MVYLRHLTTFQPEYELTVDSYEQVRERPGDNEEQEKYYSGKESDHTFKTQNSNDYLTRWQRYR